MYKTYDYFDFDGHYYTCEYEWAGESIYIDYIVNKDNPDSLAVWVVSINNREVFRGEFAPTDDDIAAFDASMMEFLRKVSQMGAIVNPIRFQCAAEMIRALCRVDICPF